MATENVIHVAYCEEDAETAYRIVHQFKWAGNKYLFEDRDGGSGIALPERYKRIQSCRLILFINTEHSIKNNLVKFLKIQSLAHSLALKQYKVLFLLHNIDGEVLPPEVKFVPHCTIVDLEERLIAPTVCLDHLLPLGNISFGLLWNYYYAYLKLILKKLKKRIDEWVNENPSKRSCTSRRLHIILPTDDEIHKSLSDADSNIHDVGTKIKVEISRAGTENRLYTNSMYKICKDNKEYFFIAEYAAPLETMSMIKAGGLTRLEEIKFQKRLFKEKLTRIIKEQEHSSNCSLVIWDKKESLSDLIMDELDIENSKLQLSFGAAHRSYYTLEKPEGASEGIHIVYCDKDVDFAGDIIKKIEERGLKCYFLERGAISGNVIETHCDKFYSCHHILFICSENSRNDYSTEYYICEALHQALEYEDSGKLKFVFLFRNSIREIPQEWKTLPHVSENADDYFEGLMEKLEAPEVSIDNLIPVGDIYCGMAWSYYYGYLDVIMTVLWEKIDVWSRSRGNLDGTEYIPRRLYVLLPIDAKFCKTLSEADSELKNVHTFDTLKHVTAAGTEREYRNTIYQINKPDKRYFVAAEYATPLKAMCDMESGPISGLMYSDLKQQAKLFNQQLSDILKHKNVISKHNECCTLVMCDETQKLSDLLVKEIEKDYLIEKNVARLSLM